MLSQSVYTRLRETYWLGVPDEASQQIPVVACTMTRFDPSDLSFKSLSYHHSLGPFLLQLLFLILLVPVYF